MASTASPAKRKGKWVEPSRYDAFIHGDLSVEDLDMEELLKGQIRDKEGMFRGRPPHMIPRSFHIKVTQELLQRAEANWRSHMDDALKVFVEVMNNPKYGAQWRLQAAQYVFERVAGKIPDKQIVEASVRKWEDAAEAVIVEIVGDEIEDAELVEEPVLGVVWEADEEEPGSLQAIEAAPSTYTVAPKPPRRPTRKNKGDG